MGERSLLSTRRTLKKSVCKKFNSNGPMRGAFHLVCLLEVLINPTPSLIMPKNGALPALLYFLHKMNHPFNEG